ncbi:Deoxyribodipyrimidine photo-lyase [Tolumonas auensis DSM 9187]|jgi:deoxyribodipyrimidine photo-lyase|uniref:Deoxyribodipyrimidine photo-lyase n=1 Tax=Tolumonas auensis (strain DSM 9187 / NBRC 110442 / TA 4) TaxID=595494 RepID=C4LDE4_TOLAT|nr:deoxyribodipyrimidine photo-lyase [Tolumonas auensis]ACQ92740.1 Deoxyribodipyrimidine photo-lyase [Tolumonas auensis DSM 9187]
MTSLVWFRDDLRVHDHPALYAASLHPEPLQAIYFVTPEQWKKQDLAPVRADLIARQLNQLGEALAALGIPFSVLTVADYQQIPARLASYCQQHEVSQLFVNRDIGIYELARDLSVQQQCDATGIRVQWFDARCVFAPGSVLTGSKEMFKVFTPFSKAWLKKLAAEGYQVWPKPSARGGILSWSSVSIDYPRVDSSDWPVGEAAVLQQLQDFCAEKLRQYDEQRDFPACPGTSRISPYLTLGIISVRQCLAAIEAALGQLPFERGAPGFVWLNELIWREFYQHLLVAFPHVSKHKAFKPETDHIRWLWDDARFTAWCEGKTGYPIVDAAMRCLNQTGWMHNRLRMIVASFLTKDLHIDWRLGERYFMQHLIDGELAANNGGWQWAASTGADAAPYFRIFNPTTQGQRFDEQGQFIKQWLPELELVPAKYIHTPHDWLKVFDPQDSYPAPIVDHSESRTIALALFQR